MRPKRATAAWTAAGESPGSSRSSATTRVAAPSAPASRAVSWSVPGSGSVAECRTVEECSRRSAPVTVRAVSTRSNPRRASSSAQPRPMPRLAPVTNATLRSAIAILRAPCPEAFHLAARDAPALRSACQLVVIAHAHGARAAVRKPVLRRAVGVAARAVAVDLDLLRGDGVAGGLVAAHRVGERGERIGDRAAGQRAAIGRVAGEAGGHEARVPRVDSAGVPQQQLADGRAVVDLGHAARSCHGGAPRGNPTGVAVAMACWREIPLRSVLPPPRSHLDAVFLDAGNTLVTFDHAVVCGMLAEEGLATTPAALARAEAAARPEVSRFLADGISSEQRNTFVFYVTRMLARLGRDGADGPPLAGRLVERLRREVPTQRLWSQVLPGVPDALRALRDAGLILVVVSNSDGSVEEGLAAIGLRPLVDGVIDSAVVGAEKPDPAIFRHALALAGVRAERTLHVGDLYHVDVVGARAAGLHAVLLDPHGDWDGVECVRSADLTSLTGALLDGRGGEP